MKIIIKSRALSLSFKILSRHVLINTKLFNPNCEWEGGTLLSTLSRALRITENKIQICTVISALNRRSQELLPY